MESKLNITPDRELDWNDTIENEGHEYVLLPEGDYPFTIVSLEKARHTPGPQGKLPPCNKAVLTVRVTAPDGMTADVRHNLFLHTSQEWKLCEFFAAIGARRKGEPLRMNWTVVPASTGQCHLKKRSFTRRDGTLGESNEISRFYPQEEKPGGFIPGQF